MKFTDGFERKFFVGNGYNSQIVHVVILWVAKIFQTLRVFVTRKSMHRM